MLKTWKRALLALAPLALLCVTPALADHHEKKGHEAHEGHEGHEAHKGHEGHMAHEGGKCTHHADCTHEGECAHQGHCNFYRDLIANLEATGKKIIDLAEAIPADKFGWRPSDEVRTTSEVFIHTAGVNLMLPSALGAAPPEGVDASKGFALMMEWEKNVTEKAAVVQKLRESFDHAAKALQSIDDLETEVTIFGPPQSKRAYFFIILGHAHEHLGQAIAYARSMGVTPPWSASNDG